MKNKTAKFGDVWIFQAVPENYDILDEVPERLAKQRIGDHWRVTHFASKMRIDDRVLLWRSGLTAGIYGTAQIETVPYRVGGKTRVDLRFFPLLEQPVLKSTLLKDPLLKNLSILRSARGTNFAVTPEEWEKLEHLVGAKRSAGTAEVADVERRTKPYDPKNHRDGRKRTMASIVQRRGQPEFRRQLMQIFQSRCLISNCDAGAVLEAAHICPYRGDHTNNPTNGLLLRADLHTLFDLYLISIDARKRRVLIAPTLEGTCYAGLKNNVIDLPKGGPSQKALEKHRAEFVRRIHKKNPIP